MVDFDSLEIGEKASVGEGTTIVGHNFDTKGNLVFHKVHICSIPRASHKLLDIQSHVQKRR